MLINNLQLTKFRNYAELNIDLDKKINIFLGNNAQGKTNILESIYLLALAKSHRTTKEKELVQWGQSFSVVEGLISNKISNKKLEIILSDKGKKAKINNIEKKKLSEYIGTINCILFGPDDLSLIKGSPQNRRKFIDIEIGQISSNYIYNLIQYQKIIKQRNNLLKDSSLVNKNKIELLEIWDEQLVIFGTKIIIKRIKFLDRLKYWVEKIHFDITNGKEKLSIIYSSSIDVNIENLSEIDLINQYKQHLTNTRNIELRRGLTLIGPHRDDLFFFINDINVQTFGSQGQQRTTALSLKLALIELIHEETGEYPLLLLDDVLSELDQKRQTHLLKIIDNKVQTIITTTSTDGIDNNTLSKAKIFHVNNGEVNYEN